MAKTPTKFDIRDRLGYRVQNLANKMILWSARTYAAEFNIGVQEWRVLAILAKKGKGTAKEICDLTLMDKGNVSRAVKKMIKGGRLKESSDKKDKRKSLLIITPKGYDIYYQVKAVSDAREKKFMSALSPSEKKQLPIILGKLHGVMDVLLENQEEQK